MKTLTAFLCGIREFRLLVTHCHGDYDHAYDLGRELAHRITLRRFEP